MPEYKNNPNYIGLKVDLVSKKGIKEKYLNSINSDLIYV